MDLLRLSHAALVALVHQQQTLLAAQQQQLTELQATLAAQTTTIQRLEQRLRDLEGGAGPPRGMPGHALQQAASRPRQPRRKRAANRARPRSEPTAQITHSLEHCPDCGIALAGGSVKRTREVIEVTPTPATITEHVYLERCCPGCGKRWTPAVDLRGQVVGQSRLGVGLLSLIATLRSEWRLPVRAIQQVLGSVHALSLSTGAVHGALGQVARAGSDTVAATLAAIRAGPVVHGDETGWREDGRNRFIWSFSTPTQRYYTCGSRAKGMIDRVLGPDFHGVLVSDFYAAYDHYDGAQQKCWVHLLRDIHDLVATHPEDAQLALWAAGVQACYRDALTQAAALTAGAASDDARRAARRACDAALRDLCRPFETHATAPQAKLCRRVAKYLHTLFTFVREPGVSSDNNAAERSVRHEVISRKISGGTRSDEGTQTRMTLATLFGTWRVQGCDPYQSCLALLTSPQV
jgi:hypothetical protein